MAKRMFTQIIIDSDIFLDMPLTAQALYFHLCMNADDDGFINNAKRISRAIGASENDLDALKDANLLITFESGVVAIRHWHMHNTLRKDRYTPTVYQKELSTLELDENNVYVEKTKKEPEMPENKGGDKVSDKETSLDNQMATTWQPNGNQMATTWQPSIGKCSVGKVSIGKCSVVSSVDNIQADSPATGIEQHTHTCLPVDGTTMPSHRAVNEEKQNGEHKHITAQVYIDLCKKYGRDFVDERAEKAYNDKALIKFCEQDFKKSRDKPKNLFCNYPQREHVFEENGELITRCAGGKE